MIRPVPTAERDEVDNTIPVRPASTVMVLRDSAAGLEVYVLRRVAGMVFAPGMTVFPGGAVDPADLDPSIGWLGPDAAWWAARLGVRDGEAHALVVAAVRELFEETGVLLAEPTTPGGSAELPDSVRLAILDRRTTLAAALAATGLRLRADLLRPWANWITPPGRTRRYDTFFFAAALPVGQQARQLTSEADLGEWRTPPEMLAAHGAGSLLLMRPTVAMLTDLAEFGTVAQALAAERVLTPMPGTRLVAPDSTAAAPGGREPS